MKFSMYGCPQPQVYELLKPSHLQPAVTNNKQEHFKKNNNGGEFQV